ncbi:hypothetical protein [Methylomonas methanica]|uniref:Uncharacterized protein n=1 Tax=Methylomonas methanica (strain DSM 25384 / MC09) TaxID=857087 RepID=G0A2L5_METMM|nr:hypothetical protein [Methylomonas methanica]AEG00195.1 hypothetical protein Metme_1777 [Methylomonas methanica MC09]
MHKFLTSIGLLLAFGEAEAHSHPGIDSLTHSLEHLATNYPAGMPYFSGLGLTLIVAVALVIRYKRRPQ